MGKTFELCDLPNQEGFKFIGVDHDLNTHECIVYKDAIGCHSVKRINDGEPFYLQLRGWRKLTNNVEFKGEERWSNTKNWTRGLLRR